MDKRVASAVDLGPADSHNPSATGDMCGEPREEDCLVEGQRVGRYVILRDINGQRHAVAAGSVAALGETDDGAVVLLPGGRMIHVPMPMSQIIRWLSN